MTNSELKSQWYAEVFRLDPHRMPDEVQVLFRFVEELIERLPDDNDER